jgi:NH3-dependent NAD+ synthetase
MRTIFLSGALAHSIGASWKIINIQGMVEAGVNGVQDSTGYNFDQMNKQVKAGRDGKLYRNNVTNELVFETEDNLDEIKTATANINGKQMNLFVRVNSPFDLTYQNIQARLRMINTYLYSQVLPVSKNKLGFYT